MAIDVGNFVVKGREPKVQTPARPANLSALNVGQLVIINQRVEEETIEEKEIVPAHRQIFNSLINKSTSRYFLDMIKQ